MKPSASRFLNTIFLCCFAVALVLLIDVTSAFGNTITVTSNADSGAGSLRAAIASAASGDTINFSLAYPATITLASTLTISSNLMISGPGASSLAISGNNSVQVFNIGTGITVTISGLTIEGGNSTGGGGIYNSGTLILTNSTLSGNSVSGGSGGGIYNSSGTLMVNNSTFLGNTISGGGGGAIVNYFGTVTVTNSTLSGNTATGFGFNAVGAGIFTYSGSVVLTNTTLSGNSAGVGGGIYDYAATVTISNSTLSGNSASYFGGGGIFVQTNTVTVKNTIIANSPLGNCYPYGGTIVSEGYNLSDDTSCTASFNQTGDQNGTPAGFDPNGLRNNGGPTQTIGLLAMSAAVDAVPLNPTNYCTDANGAPVTTDQRGFARPQGPACDIGAFELVVGDDSGVAQLNNANTFNGAQTVNGNVTATDFVGSGAGLTGVNASTLGGVPASSYALLSGGNVFGGNQTVSGNVTANFFYGDGSNLMNITASNANYASSAGVALSAGNSSSLGDVIASNYARLDIGNIFNGTQTFNGFIITPFLNATNGSFSGTGQGGGPVLEVSNNGPIGALSATSTGGYGIYVSTTGGNLLLGQVNGVTAFSVDGSGDVNASGVSLGASGVASENGSFPSFQLDQTASAYNGSAAVPQLFRWQAEPTNAGTNNASGSLNLLFGAGGNTPSETGLSVNANGTINFATGQTFPGAGGGSGTISGVTAGTGLAGGGFSGNVTLSLASNSCPTGSALTALPFACAAFAGLGPNSFTGNQSVSGTVTATSFVGDGSALANVNALTAASAASATNAGALGGQPPSFYATTGANTFTGSQTITGGYLELDNTNAAATTGVITMGGTAVFHNYGSQNMFVGENAGNFSLTGNYNNGFGYQALHSNTSGFANTAVGSEALQNNANGFDNTAAGYQSLNANTAGGYNTAFGYALIYNTTGSNNTAVGFQAGVNQNGANANTTGSNNTFLGYSAGPQTPNQLTNATAIGSNAVVNASNALVLGSISGLNGASFNTNVGIGTSTPGYSLDVQGGQINASGGLCIAGVCQTNWPSGGSGTITGVTAGTGLTGGGTSGNVPLSVNESVVAFQSDLANGVTTAESFATTAANSAVNTSESFANNTFLPLAGGTLSGNLAINGGDLALPNTNGTGTAGVITLGGTRFLHNFGGGNTFVGQGAGNFTMTGVSNTATGYDALFQNSGGGYNTASGQYSLSGNTSGGYNTASGQQSLFGNTTGSYNTSLGFQSGNTTVPANVNTAGSYNTFIGSNSGPGVASSSSLQNATAIGASAVVNASNALVLGSINGVNGATSNVNVGIGTATPGYALDVESGQVNASGGLCIANVCQTTWPSGQLGTVTNVATGAGLTGGPITSSGTISVANGGITNAMLASGSVTSTDIAAGSIVDANVSATAAINPTKINGTAAVLGANTFTGTQTMPALSVSGNSTVLGTGNFGGTSYAGNGIVAASSSGNGVEATTATGVGVLGITANQADPAVWGVNSTSSGPLGFGVQGNGIGGVNAIGTSGPGISAQTSSAAGTTAAGLFNNIGSTNAGNIILGQYNGTNEFTVDAKGDVTANGLATVAGELLPSTGAATATQGFNSNALKSIASVFNSSAAAAQNQMFLWQAEPKTGTNDTPSPSATMNLLFGANGATPSETGLSLNANGTLNFATGQTFPGTGPGTITSITAGAGLAGGGSSGNVSLSIPAGDVTNAMLANPSLTVAAGSGVTVTGGSPIALGGAATVSLTSQACAAGSAVTAHPFTCTAFPAFGANTFTGVQTMPGLAVSGNAAVAGTGTFGGASYASTAVQGTTSTGIAVEGISNAYVGVFGQSVTSTGVDAYSTSGDGLYALTYTTNTATTAAAGVFNNVQTTNPGNILLGQYQGANEFIVDAKGDVTGNGVGKFASYSVSGTVPTCAFTSGGGTSPTCALDTGSTNSAGIIIATTGTGAPAGTGTVTLTFSATFGADKPACIYQASDDGTGAWNGLAVMKDKTPSTASDLFTWTNGATPTVLTASRTYYINYHCFAK